MPKDLTLQGFHQLSFAHEARQAYFLSLQMTDDVMGNPFLEPEQNPSGECGRGIGMKDAPVSELRLE